MTDDRNADVQSAAERVLEIEEEVEGSGEAAIGGSSLENARAVLHAWIDRAKGVVVSPALGRVTVIHENGRTSTISSPDLPFEISAGGRSS